MADAGTPDVQKLTFEQAIDQLETIVKRLEEGKVPLEESVAIYERGEAFAPSRGPGREDHPGRVRQARRNYAPGRGLAATGRYSPTAPDTTLVSQG